MFKRINAIVNEIKAGYVEEREATKSARELAKKVAEEKGRNFVRVAYDPAFATGYTVEVAKEVAGKVAGTKVARKVTSMAMDIKESATLGYEDGKNARVSHNERVADKMYEDAMVEQATREMIIACGGPAPEEA
jgi:hypothetical protein